VDVEVIDVFIPSIIVPFVEITKDLAIWELWDSKGCVCIWSRKFFMFS
jgi:hypothetical protein